MNAGSYVMSPKSSAPVLICRRSIARMVPFWTGSSYCLPVRLSVIVNVSGIRLLFRHRFPGYAVRPVGPSGQILGLAPLAAERPPRRIDRMLAAEHTDVRLRHGQPDI